MTKEQEQKLRERYALISKRATKECDPLIEQGLLAAYLAGAEAMLRIINDEQENNKEQ